MYHPSRVGAASLRLNDLRQILLAIATREYDALILVRHSGTGIDLNDLSDALIIRRSEAGRWKSGAILNLRLYPTEDASPATPTLFRSEREAARPGVRIPMLAPLLNLDPRPVVFILPAFLAVGGVERIVIEIARLLADKWRFVIVTTEALRPEQGSTHREALEFAPVYDLAELASPEDRLQA